MSEYYNRQWRLPNNENKNKQSNYSMDFDGSQKVNLGNTNAVKLGAGDFTFSAWINPDFWGSTYEAIYANAGTNGVFIGKDNAGNFVLRIYNVSNIRTYSTLPTIGAWTHICVTRDNGQCILFYNGSIVATATSTHNFNASANVFVGSDNGSGNFNGQIDGVAIFDYALSSSQVTTLYGSSSTGIGNPMSLSPKPVAYYPLGDQESFNGANYLVPNSSLKDYVFSFDGLAEITTGGISGISSNTTVSFWFNNSTAASGNYVPLIASLNYTSTTYENFAFRLKNGLQTNKKIEIVLAKSGIFKVLETSAIIDNAWYFVALTTSTSGSSVTATLYLNGTQVATNSGTDFSNLNDLQNGLTIGHWTAVGNQNNFNGTISNVQVFNTALSATGSNSIETLYNNGSPLTSMSGYSSLQGWWKLDASDTYDGTNWTVTDHSSNSNTGTSSGMTQANLVQSDLSFTSGYSPYALNFEGANDKINLNSDIGLSGAAASTFSMWVNFADLTNAGLILNSGPTNNGGSDGLFIYSNTLYFRVNDNVSATISSFSSVVSTGKWYHICGVFSGGNYLKIYLNGVDTASTSTAQSTMSNSITNFVIGHNGWYGYFNGPISNVSIWNTALTQAQVTEIYSEGVPQNLNNHSAYSNLVSWWQLGSNSSFFNANWIVLDEKGSNDGTSVNMSENAIVDGVGSYANGTSSGMGGDEVIGDAPYSTANALSVNMDIADRTTDVPS